MITVSIYAQKNNPTTNTQTDKINWISFKAAEQTSAAQLVQNKAVLQFQDKDGLDLISEKTDQPGMHHYRYQQTYNGIPVEGAIYLLHEKNNRVKTANGKLIHQLKLSIELCTHTYRCDTIRMGWPYTWKRYQGSQKSTQCYFLSFRQIGDYWPRI